MSEHRFDVGAGWSIWRQIFLRGAGFPIEQVLELESPRASDAADSLIEHEASGAELIEAAAQDLRDGTHDPSIKKECKKVLSRLMKGAPLNASEELRERYPSVSGLADWQSIREQLHTTFGQKYDEDEVVLDKALAEISSDARLREAIAWQNAAAAKVVLPALRDPQRKQNAKQRMRWRLVANYLQRYCTKNDTIGFFGPVGWAAVSPAVDSIRFQAGEHLLARRRVHFEIWAIDVLAKKYSLDEELWPSIVPRQNPNGYLDGQDYYDRDGDASELPEEFCAAYQACDARRTMREIAQSLIEDDVVESEDEAYEILLALSESNLIYDRFEFTINTRYPEPHLRALLERAPESESRTRALAELGELEERRQAVEAAGGNPDELANALEELNQYFEKISDASSTRAGGEAYAGRTLVYEDCIRDVELTFGEDLIGRISEPMVLILQSARWFCWEISQRYRREFRRIFDELSAKTGSHEVSLLRFFEDYLALFPGPDEEGGIVDDVRRELQTRWASVLQVDPSSKRVNVDVGAIRAKVAEIFDAPGPGWPSARHHSPDILLSAAGIEALREGDFTAVLGELHVGCNTVALPHWADECFHPERLVAAREADMPIGITPTCNTPNRVMNYSISDRDFELESGVGLSHLPREQVLSSGACVVVLKDDELYVRSRDGGPQFHILEFVDEHMASVAFSEFQVMPELDAYGPRVTLDGLVLRRETWRVEATEIPGNNHNDRKRAFVEVREWAREMGFPRFIFVKTPSETKPFFVDLNSAVLVSVFLRHVQEPGRVSISEMLPDFDHAWLEDREGLRYSTELRTCYVDPVEWSP